MHKKELKKVNGDLFFEADRRGANSFIYVNWIGIQSIETIMLGANQILSILKQDPCPAILNSNRELIGPWDDGALFMGGKWVLEANMLGVVHFAHVLSPGIYGQRSFLKFYQQAHNYLQIGTFSTEIEAESWLLGH